MKRHCTLSQWLCHTNNGWGRTATNILTNQTSFSKIKHQSLFLKLIAWVIAASKGISVTVSSAIHDFSWALQLPDFPHTDGQSLEPKEWVLRAQGLHSGRPLLAGLPYLSRCVTVQVDRAVRRWPVTMMRWAEEDFTSHARDLGQEGFCSLLHHGAKLRFPISAVVV